ncbi:MAG TPA: diguanylate cyclase [Terriglobales bacterium]|nr:diguanylate cyclase [Terriglobales bacterium]
MRVGTAIIAAVLAIATLSRAQELSVPDKPRFVFQKLGEDVGLGTLTVTSIVQDEQGFMWIGTQTGLIRYDGRRAQKYSVEHGLPSTIIDQVVVGPRNLLVIGTRKGIAVYDGSRFQRLPRIEGAAIDPGYQYVAADKSGNVYWATTMGLFRMPAGETRWEEIKIDGGPRVPIGAVYLSGDGAVWFAGGGRVGAIRGKRAMWLTAANGIAGESIIGLVQDGDGTLWVRTGKSMWRYDGATRELLREKENIPAANDYGVPIVDLAGNLVVPTVAGIYRREDGHWQAIDRTRGMPMNAVYAVAEDQEGAYWLGLAGGGVVRWQGTESWKGWTEAEGLPDNVIWAEARDNQKRLWVGTNNGVAMWDADRRSWRKWNADTGLNGSVVRAIATTGDGAIWVQSAPGGLTRFDPITLRPVSVPTPSPAPTAIIRGLDGRLWLGSKRYLKALVEDRPPYRFEDIQVPKQVQGLTAHLKISDGVLWSSGANGLARFEGNSWRAFTAKNGLKDDAVSDLAIVNADEVWFVYNEAFGLWRLKVVDGRPQVQHFGTADGLPADEVYLVGADHSGNIWSGGPLGLTVFPRSGKPRHFTSSDGLIWDDLDAEAFYRDEDGSLYFGTSGGLARYNPAAPEPQVVTKPKVVITSVQLGNNEYPVGAAAEVKYKANTLDVQFSALTYRDIDRVRCSYRLRGLETESNETTQREVRYPALPAGDYTFEVSCRSGFGVASAPATFHFTVLRPWWQRWDVRLIALAMLLMGVAALFKYRVAHLERERLRLEVAVAQRNTELARTNQELKEASLTDPLTGTRNRRFFDLIITSDVNQAIRTYSPPLSFSGGRNRDLVLYLIDVDHFKQINDDYGHAAGDRVLVEITNRINSVMRQTDVLIRWGGEEFLLLSRAAERSEAENLAARVLNAVGEDPYDLPTSGETLHRTCSVGWAPFPWFTEKPDLVGYETILKMVDRALYRSKDGGRNRAFGVVPIDNAESFTGTGFDQLQFEWTELLGPRAEDSAKTEL